MATGKVNTWLVVAVGMVVFMAALCAMWLWSARVVDPWAGRARTVETAEGKLRSGEVRDYSVPGAFGDAFAPIIGLMTAAALAATVASVIMQSKELELQRDEMREARKQWTDQAAALKDANMLQARANDLAERDQLVEIARQISDLDRAAADLIHWAKERAKATSDESLWDNIDPADYWHTFWSAHPNARESTYHYRPRVLCDYADQRELLLHMYRQVRESARDFGLGMTGVT